MGSIWHIGIAVPDLEKGQQKLGEVFGLRWRPARVRKLTLTDAAGRPSEVECHVVFSLGGPFAVEVWQAIPGTPLDMPQAGGCTTSATGPATPPPRRNGSTRSATPATPRPAPRRC